MLRLNLERDFTRRNAIEEDSEKDADPPVNPQRRDLFQSCYDFLLGLCRGNPAAQVPLKREISLLTTYWSESTGPS